MILRNCDMTEFIRRVKGKKLLCFGAGNWLEILCSGFPNYEIEKHISYIVDNNSSLWGSEKTVNGVAIPVCSPHKLVADADSDTVILITNMSFFFEIYNQLNNEPKLNDVDCYLASYLYGIEYHRLSTAAPSCYRANNNPVIPKVIHYFWFGGKPLPARYQSFIDSWRKFCPDYEIIEWNETNYDFNRHPFTREAAKIKKWSKVASYARLDIVYKYGGINMDTDVEVIKPLDELLYNDAYIGFENRKLVNSGSGFGAVKNFPLIGELRDYFDNIPFIKSDGSYNLTACPEFETELLRKRGLNYDAQFQIIDRLAIYPSEYFSPKCIYSGLMNVTENTFSIHHYDGTWLAAHIKESYALAVDLYKVVLENEKRYCNTYGGLNR